jgi:hypothetical protein
LSFSGQVFQVFPAQLFSLFSLFFMVLTLNLTLSSHSNHGPA